MSNKIKETMFNVIMSVMLLPFFSIVWQSEALAAVEPRAETTLELFIPSGNQLTIAPNRDFYVFGSIGGQGLPEDALVEITLVKKGDTIPVRQVYTNKKDNRDGLNIYYDKLSYYAGDDRSPLRESLMPDLVYDPSVQDSFKDAWRKCYYTDDIFTAVIHGGNYDIDVSPIDQNGNHYELLEQGVYTVKATISENDGTELVSSEQEIVLDYVAEKIMTRFSPAEHFNRVQEEAEINKFQILLDPFPGYWSPGSVIPLMEGSEIFAEILPKWRLANATEFQRGRANFYIYNVSRTSATYNVEVGTLQDQQVIDLSDRVVYYYYQYGEPSIPEVGKSPFVKFAPSSKLQVTRADISDTSDGDNILNPESLEDSIIDLDITDGVEMQAGRILSINGVVQPIQNKPEDIVKNDDNSYEIGNQIKTVKYNIYNEQTEVSISKEVGVTRLLNGNNSHSLLEFKHDLEIQQEWANQSLTVRMQGYDTDGLPVLGTTVSFELNVTEAIELPNAA